MTNDIEFSANVGRLFVKPVETKLKLVHASLGLCSEAGELASAIKAAWIYGRPFDENNIIEEIGDCLFYLQAICHEFDITFSDAMAENIAKLHRRYPVGYSDEAANERADKVGSDA